jgi:predicted PurR-regulated permease PerM
LSATVAAFDLRVPFATLLKLAFFALLIVATIKLWGVIVLFLVVVVPLMVSEIRQLATDLPRITQRFAAALPSARPAINAVMAQSKEAQTPVRQWISRGLLAGMYVTEGLIAVVLVFVFTIYLLLEGRQMFEWLIAFAPEDKRPRIRRTAAETSKVVLAYMRGQAITCFACGGVALTTLLILRVPAAVPLAVLAFLCDLIPVVGTIIMTAPAVLLALLVSPAAAIIVVVVYLAYHLVESYVIIPKVYGDQMRLSTLTVLLAVTAGGTLQGPVGAVLILPFVAAYPIVERIWLRDRLPDDTVEKHEDAAER